MYPEIYRCSDYVKGSNDAVPEPYQIGRIKEISSRRNIEDLQPEHIKFVITIFYR